jgi:hypothetical protein
LKFKKIENFPKCQKGGRWLKILVSGIYWAKKISSKVIIMIFEIFEILNFFKVNFSSFGYFGAKFPNFKIIALGTFLGTLTQI